MKTDYDAKLGLYIDGAWHTGEGRETLPIIDPATGGGLAGVPFATTADLDRALEASSRGFAKWRATPAEERSTIMMRASALLRSRADRIARIATLEQGKIHAEAMAEVAYAASLIDFHAGETRRTYGRVLPRAPGTRSMVLQEPVGPVAAFCAWNFPITNVVRKLSPALAAGCSVIIKPSEETVGSAVEVIRCFQDAGLPGDVVQCVFGIPDAISRHLLASPVTRKLSFTGSVAVGKHLLRLAANTMMKSTMELGGHAPVLVFKDCDLERTLDMLVTHKFRNAGQVCIAPTRFNIQADIYDRFVAGFAERTRKLKIGNGLASESQMGPLANARRPIAMNAIVDDAIRLGGRVVTGGDQVIGNGFFFMPTVLADVSLDSMAMNEEPFGPLALIRPFDTDDEAIEEANRLPFGPAAYCFTENGKRQNRLGDEIAAGMVAVNNVRLGWVDSPFGGMKDSGHGSEDGPEGVAAHLVSKAFHVA